MSAGDWGNASKVYTASREMYDRITEESSDIFPRIIDVFHMAAAVGLALGQRKSFDRQTPEIANMYSVDGEQVLAAVIAAQHPEASADERYKLLLEYAEYGVAVIDEEVQATGTFNPLPYFE